MPRYFDIATIATGTGLTARKLRYVLDHQLVPGVKPLRSGRGDARRLSAFQAFATAVAGALLEYGYSRTVIQDMMLLLGGARRSRRKASLYKLFRSTTNALVIGNAEAICLDGKWYDHTGKKLPREFDPVILTVVQLDLLREVTAA